METKAPAHLLDKIPRIFLWGIFLFATSPQPLTSHLSLSSFEMPSSHALLPRQISPLEEVLIGALAVGLPDV
ncbi:MAG: hypothetical protein OXI59_04985, partial [Gemmatimonadota bacterium]|nr:hypothetical protein [Gemmatimonadota bacterium]